MERHATILLVEDEHVLRGLVAQFLQGAGHKVVQAGDGQQGVDRFREAGPFDLALVDLNLPVFSGVEVCRRLRAQHPEQPIIICSAAVVPESETALRDLGVDHYLTKPYHPDVLLKHIDDELRRSEAPAKLRADMGHARRIGGSLEPVSLAALAKEGRSR
ncbi:MAG: hypothetical protein NVSMB14_17560 [Isosphaeraceae bacterium]